MKINQKMIQKQKYYNNNYKLLKMVKLNQKMRKK